MVRSIFRTGLRATDIVTAGASVPAGAGLTTPGLDSTGYYNFSDIATVLLGAPNQRLLHAFFIRNLPQGLVLKVPYL